VADSFDDVTSSGLTFRADHGRAFADATEGFAEVATAADKGDAETVFLNVMGVVSWGEDFGLVDVVYAYCFKDLFTV